MSDIFEQARAAGTKYIQSWFTGGYEENGQLVVRNPKRDDSKPGSFKINLTTGAYRDYADDDCKGGDCVALYAWLNDLRNYDAAQEILRQYEPFWEPSQATREERKASWRQLERGHKNAPELKPQTLKYNDPNSPKEIARWPLKIQVNSEWRIVQWIVRFIDEDGSKTERPYTLFSDGKELRWQRKALGCSYPLYGLQDLVERPNAPVLLMEGQKAPSVVAPVLGDEWTVCGFAGGSSNVSKTDFDPLTGREIWVSFDGDMAGRKALMKVLAKIKAKVHIVYPPLNCIKGWDLADVVEIQGGGKEELLDIILKEERQEIAKKEKEDFKADHRPTRLDVKVEPAHSEEIIYNVYTENHKKDGMVLRHDWVVRIVELDAAIRNSIKYDYTTGTKSIAYESTDLYDGHLEERLRQLGIPSNVVTKVYMDKMKRAILIRNCNCNRVADYVALMQKDYPSVEADILDDFMQIFRFSLPMRENEEDYEGRMKRVRGLYRELFHMFFLRMHARIRGTKKTETGEYHGLIENDIVPILEGPQEIGKTTLCRWLACDDDFYIDLGSGLKTGFGNAETVKKIRGMLLAEIGEMKIMKSPDSVEVIKSFISMRAGKVDIKYVENQRDLPMTCSFIGTSNLAQYLSDETGNRRFWPVRLTWIDKDYISRNPDLPRRIHAYYASKVEGMTMEDIYQEAKPSKELAAMMEEYREEAMITYSDYDVCIKMIRRLLADTARQPISQADVERLAKAENYPTRISQRGFRRAAKSMGLVQKRVDDMDLKKPILKWVYEEDIPF